jgi:hypothetical protein
LPARVGDRHLERAAVDGTDGARDQTVGGGGLNPVVRLGGVGWGGGGWVGVFGLVGVGGGWGLVLVVGWGWVGVGGL